MADKIVSCATCRAFNPTHVGLSPSIGTCRLKPPKVHILYVGTAKCENVMTYWPEVSQDEWCCAWPGKELVHGE